MTTYTLAELAALCGAELVGNPQHQIEGVENLNCAGPNQAAFFENPRYEKQMEESKAGVIVVPPSQKPVSGKNFLLHKAPSHAFQTIIELFIKTPPSGFQGIHPTAILHPEVILGDQVTIGPYAILDRGVKVGDRTVIGPSVSIGAEVTIGCDCHFYSHVSIREGCQIGNRVVIQPGAVIGSCGFGYVTNKQGKHVALKQLGIVILEDDVDIGANTTIDRARFKVTRIGRGTKIDNLVQIAHQVELGQDNLIVSQVGIAGSTTTGRNVIMGGQVGVIGHLTIGDGVIFTARSAPTKSIDKPGIYGGAPAAPLKEFNTSTVHVKNLGKLIDRVKELEKKIEELSLQNEKSV